MSNKPHDVTAPDVLELTRILLRTLAEQHGGDCTFDQLRVMNQISRCNLDGRTCSVTALHRVTGIPIRTVSRVVANLRHDGWLSERQNPTDRRRQIISLGPRTLKAARKDIDRATRLINVIREHGLLN